MTNWLQTPDLRHTIRDYCASDAFDRPNTVLGKYTIHPRVVDGRALIKYNCPFLLLKIRAIPVEQKTARFTVLMDPRKKRAFEQLCASQDLTPSQVVRQLIREYLEKHNVSYGEDAPANNPQVKL